MDNVNVSLADVSNTASAIRLLANEMSDVLDYIASSMRELHNYWSSEGEEVLMERFINFSRKFIEDREVLDQYAKFLDYTVSTYDSMESTIVSNASNFK